MADRYFVSGGSTNAPAWSNVTDYPLNYFVRVAGTSYMSLQNPNINHNPATSPSYWSTRYSDTLDTSNWSNGTGGVGGFSIPDFSDDVFLDEHSPDAYLLIERCQNIDFTRYHGDLFMGGSVTIWGGSCILSALTTYSESFLGLIFREPGLGGDSNKNLTTNGAVITLAITSGTVNLLDDLNAVFIFINLNAAPHNPSLSASNKTINIIDSPGAEIVNLHDKTAFVRGTSTVNILGDCQITVGADSLDLYNFTIADGVNLNLGIAGIYQGYLNIYGKFEAHNCTIFNSTYPSNFGNLRSFGTQDVSYVTATGMRSAGGNIICDYFGTLDDCIYWDTDCPPSIDVACGVVGVVAGTINNLDHLEGQEVAILADGEVLDRQVVQNGQIDLPEGYAKVHVGLPIESDFETLNVELPMPNGTLQGRKVKIGNVTFRLVQSRGGWVGPNRSRIYNAFNQAIINKLGGENLALMYTGDIRVPLGAGYEDGGRIFYRQKDPLPITIGAVIPEVNPGGASG